MPQNPVPTKKTQPSLQEVEESQISKWLYTWVCIQSHRYLSSPSRSTLAEWQTPEGISSLQIQTIWHLWKTGSSLLHALLNCFCSKTLKLFGPKNLQSITVDWHQIVNYNHNYVHNGGSICKLSLWWLVIIQLGKHRKPWGCKCKIL